MFRALLVSVHIALIAPLVWMGGNGATRLVMSPPAGSAAQILPYAVFITAVALLSAVLVAAGLASWMLTGRRRLLVVADLSSWAATGVVLVPFLFLDFADAFAFGAATVALLALTIYSIILRFKVRRTRRAAESWDDSAA